MGLPCMWGLQAQGGGQAGSPAGLTGAPKGSCGWTPSSETVLGPQPAGGQQGGLQGDQPVPVWFYGGTVRSA